MAVPIVDGASVEAAVTPSEAIERVHDALARHARGEWTMPPKVYVDAAPSGDFRAMPALGGGLAVLKWVTSFPGNPSRGLPVVAGALLASDARTGALRAILDCASVTAIRTGAAAAVSARALARPGARTAGLIGAGVNGSWAARCLAAVGYGPGVVHDIREEAAGTLARELGWKAGTRAEAAGCDVLVTVTPGDEPVIRADGLVEGQHIAVLGADAAGKAEVEPGAFARCRLFCDEWAQASKGGELAGPVARGEVGRDEVTEIGAVIEGTAAGRVAESDVTLFDSTGLAIQDLAIAHAVLEALDEDRIEPAAVADL